MNDLSSQSGLILPVYQKPRVAVLVDGENVSLALAGQIIMKSCVYGDLVIRRVYGNAARLTAWDSAPGFRLMHSGVGKNATDILLCVEATALMLTGARPRGGSGSHRLGETTHPEHRVTGSEGGGQHGRLGGLAKPGLFI